MRKKIILLMLLSVVTFSTMAQEVSLIDLFKFQHDSNPTAINNALRVGNLWTASSTDLSDPHGNYTWVNVPREGYFDDERDKILYQTDFPIFKAAAIMYYTRDRITFDRINTSIVSQMHNDGDVVTSNIGRLGKFSDEERVVEVFETLEPDTQGISKFAIIVYSKDDYNKGYRIR